MTEHELKPCPFCGGNAGLIKDDKPWVACLHCGNMTDLYDTAGEAIAAWNTRAERTCCMTDRGECSECGAYIVRAWTEVHDFNGDVKRIDLRSHSYCPNCGAKVVNE